MPIRSVVGLIVGTILPIAAAVPAPAQESDSGSTPKTEKPCRGRTDGRNCGLRFTPEFGAYIGTGLGEEIRTNWRVGIGLGATYPIGPRASIGLSGWLMTHDGTSASVLGRYRSWIGNAFVVDAAIGTYVGVGFDGDLGTETLVGSSLRFPSPIVDAGVSYRDWIGLRARFEFLSLRGWKPADPDVPYGEGTSVDVREGAVLIGAQVGRGLGILGWAAAAGAVIIAGIACCS